MRGIKFLLSALLIFNGVLSAQTGPYVQPLPYRHYSLPFQINIGNGILKKTDTSAYLEVGPFNGASKGFLPPRLTTAERANIPFPKNGLQIFNKTTVRPEWYDSASSTWRAFGSTYSYLSPIIIENDSIKIKGLSSYGTSGQLPRSTGTGWEYFTPSYVSTRDRFGLSGEDVTASANRSFSVGGYNFTINNAGQLTLSAGSSGNVVTSVTSGSSINVGPTNIAVNPKESAIVSAPAGSTVTPFIVDDSEDNTGYVTEFKKAGVMKAAIGTEGNIMLKDISAPSTPGSGYGTAYMRADSFRVKNDAGIEFTLGSAGSGGLAMKARRSIEIVTDSAQLVNDSASFVSGAVKVYGYDTTRGWKDAAKIVLSTPQEKDGLRYKSSNRTWVNYSLIQNRLQFQVDTTTNSPASGDSTLTHANFMGKHLRLYRDGLMQTQDDTTEGFELSDSILTVHPPWVSGERIIIETSDTTVWSELALQAPSGGGGGGWVDITPLSAQTGLTESPTNVWAAAGSAFNDYGLSSLSLPSSTDGAFIFQIVATTGEADMIIGFNASNTNQNYTNYEAGVYMAYNGGSDPIIYKIDSGTPTSTGIGIAPGTYVGIFRVGSTFTIRTNTVKDTDFSTWTTRATLTYTSSAAMYMNINPNNTHSYKIYYPQCKGCL